MPNVTLLIPIADVLDITVTELLQGEKLKENKTLNSDVVETLVVNSLDFFVNAFVCKLALHFCKRIITDIL